jgi:hypothetical protein
MSHHYSRPNWGSRTRTPAGPYRSLCARRDQDIRLAPFSMKRQKQLRVIPEGAGRTQFRTR